MWALFSSLVALCVGPALSLVGARGRVPRAVIDSFVLVVVTGLGLAFILPHVIEAHGELGLFFVLVGALLSAMNRTIGNPRAWSSALIGVSLLLHVVIDGALLSASHHDAFSWAIVAHRLPVSFALVAAARVFQRKAAEVWIATALLSLATLAGYFAGSTLVGMLPFQAAAGLEAVVVGALLHVILRYEPEEGQPNDSDDQALLGHNDHGFHHHGHDHHHHGHHHHAEGSSAFLRGAQMFGIALAVAALGLLATKLGSHAHDDAVSSFANVFTSLLFESAPALILGFGLASVVPLFMTSARTASLSKGSLFVQSFRGVLYGLPLPVCSCGVLPIYQSLIRKGAPATAAMAFFVATPELGLDAVLLSFPLLGSSLTIARIVAALLVALLTGLLVAPRNPSPSAFEPDSVSLSDQNGFSRLSEGLRFGFVEMFDHTMPWIALGLAVAALAEPLLSQSDLRNVPSILQVPLAALVGVPMYVCASGATPLAAVAVHQGLSAGAALSFLIAGPATNITTFGVLARLHGRRLALLFGLSVTGMAILAGWSVDLLGVTAAPVVQTEAPAAVTWIQTTSVLLLGALVLGSLFRQGPRGIIKQIVHPIHAH